MSENVFSNLSGNITVGLPYNQGNATVTYSSASGSSGSYGVTFTKTLGYTPSNMTTDEPISFGDVESKVY